MTRRDMLRALPLALVAAVAPGRPAHTAAQNRQPVLLVAVPLTMTCAAQAKFERDLARVLPAFVIYRADVPRVRFHDAYDREVA